LVESNIATAHQKQAQMKIGRELKVAALVAVSAAGLVLLAYGAIYLWVMLPCWTRHACL
jgi:hypothetical protein